MSEGRIPNDYLFVWDDNFLPYVVYLAIKSVAVQCRADNIYLLKTPQLNQVPNYLRLVREVDCFRPIDIDLPAWLEEAQLPCAKELMAAYSFLKERNYYGSISDLLRALKLYLGGGIYLDTDTLTLRDLAPLQEQEAFVPEEHILVSSKVYKRNSRWRYLRTGPLTAARDICSRVSFGVPCFQRISSFYTRAVHNAVMGFRAGHPLMRDALIRMAENYPRRPQRYPLLGPDTLQDLIEERTYPGLRVYPPSYFSPLGPTMTFQYFRRRKPKQIEALAGRVIGPETRAIHWCKNGTISKAIPKDDEDLKRLGEQQLFCHLAIAATGGGPARSNVGAAADGASSSAAQGPAQTDPAP